MSAPTAIVQRFLDEVLSGGRPGSASDLVGNDLLRQRVDAWRRSFADLAVSPVRLVAEGPYVAVHLLASGTHTGRFQGGGPTGRSWTSSCTAILEVRDDRIVDFWITWDLLDILEQTGLVTRRADASA